MQSVCRAMVLAAGYGKRMRPITATIPKVLVEVGGKALLDHLLDRLDEAGVDQVIVNVHYLADLVEMHLSRRETPRITISDERAAMLGTGGAVRKVLPGLGSDPFLILNGDSLWIEGTFPNLDRLEQTFDPARMDALLLLAPTAQSIGYDGRGDFTMTPDGILHRRAEREVAPFVYAGVALVRPDLFADVPEGAFSLNLLFDRAIAADRLHGVRMDGIWMHVGTPEAIREAEASIAASAA